MEDREVIEAFVHYLGENGYPGLQVQQWPDRSDRRSEEIDAIAGEFAIEHTSVDTLPGQRRDSDWFIQAVGGIEDDVSCKLPFRLAITLEYSAVSKGQDWSLINHTLKEWIRTSSGQIADGRYTIDDIPKVPFRLHIEKASDRRPRVIFMRFDPGDDEAFSDRIRKQLDRKAKKLWKYQKMGKTTILLVENDDIALMNTAKMLEGISEAYQFGLPNGVDQLWYADTSIPTEIWFEDFTSELSR